MKAFNVVIPWPPTVNHYWVRTRRGMAIGKRGLEFRKDIARLSEGCETLDGPLVFTAKAYYPDKRRRDLDNILKATLDAMEHAGVYKDDSQLEHIDIQKAGYDKPGRVEISITEREVA